MSVSAVGNAKTIKVRGSWDVLLRRLCFSVVRMMVREDAGVAIAMVDDVQGILPTTEM